MTLQEAFMERNDLRKKITRTQEELDTVLITDVDEPQDYDAKDKLEQIEVLTDALEILNITIEKANSINIERLHHLRMLDEKIRIYTRIKSKLQRWERKRTIGYSDSTIVETKRNLDFENICEIFDALEKERRTVDKELQKANWQTEI